MKAILLTIISAISPLTAAAQASDEALMLSSGTAQGLYHVENGIRMQQADTLLKGIPLLEKYTDALADPNKRHVALEANAICGDSAFCWRVMDRLSHAYAYTGNLRVARLATFAGSYHHTQGHGSLENYYGVMEGLASYYTQHQQQPDSVSAIASSLLSEALAAGDSSLVTSSCYFMLATADFMRQDSKQALKHLEQAYEAGRKVEHRFRQPTSIYINYVNAACQLVRGYSFAGYNQRALGVAEDIAPGIAEVYGKNSVQYLTVLGVKIDLLSRLTDINRLHSVVNETDSLCRITPDVPQQLRSLLETTVSKFRQLMASSTAESDGSVADILQQPAGNTAGITSWNKVQALLSQAHDATQAGNDRLATSHFDEALREMEGPDSQVEPGTYASVLMEYTDMLFAHHRFEKAQSVLAHARDHLLHIPYGGKEALRFVDLQEGILCNAMNEPQRARSLFISAKSGFEKTGDDGITYINCLQKLSALMRHQGKRGYAKLMLDEASRCVHRKIGLAPDNEITRSWAAVTASQYVDLEYYDTARQQIEQLFAAYGDSIRSVEWDEVRQKMAVIRTREGNYAEAARLMRITLQAPASALHQANAFRFLTCAEMQQGMPETALHLDKYIETVRSNYAIQQAVLSPLGRMTAWDACTNELSWMSNTALVAMKTSPAVCRTAYNNALYVNSRQEHAAHDVPSWQQVQQMLDADEAAIEFVLAYPDMFDNNRKRYMALIIRKDAAAPVCVDLCPANDVDDILHDVQHTDIALINSVYDLKNAKVYDLICRPLEQQLKDVRRIYYTPVGYIARMNIGALSDGRKRMADHYEMHCLTTTALVGETKAGHWQKGGTAAIYGGIAYDESQADMKAAARAYAHRPDGNSLLAQRSLSDVSRQRGVISELPATLEEAQFVSQTLTGCGYKTRLYTGSQANEESLKVLSGHAPALLHLATHGFVLSTDHDVHQHRSITESLGTTARPQQSAMLYSGLLLAGSHHAWSGEAIGNDMDDGILTAYELSQLDLTGCRLAVLSACETSLGMGDGRNSTEYGITRALKMAHVGTIVSALWEVPDEATALLMQHFYAGIARGDAPREALRKAQREVSKTHPEPYNWAAFQVTD